MTKQETLQLEYLSLSLCLSLSLSLSIYFCIALGSAELPEWGTFSNTQNLIIEKKIPSTE